ncbi:MAG: phosphatidate cytidylyltransferase [Clostridia bacterium]|nr:phosphatidate cytidylyltransferase [Clostridia bacterium]
MPNLPNDEGGVRSTNHDINSDNVTDTQIEPDSNLAEVNRIRIANHQPPIEIVSKKRLIMTGVIALVFVGMILLGEFFTRTIVSIFLYVVIAVCVVETRNALGERIPKQFSWLVWMYALLFGVPYYFFGYVGVVLFTLIIFIVGCAVAVVTNQPGGALQNFTLILVYPALLLSSLLFINRSASYVPVDPATMPGVDYSILGETLLPYNTIGLGLVFSVSSFSDMFALLFGKLFGKHKLAPLVSPKKSIEGALGGILGGVIGAGLVYFLFEVLPMMGVQLFKAGLPLGDTKILLYIIIGIFGSVCTQIGDLTASLIKRQCGRKDFSRLLGEHGGFMDRFDGIMLNGCFVAIMWAFVLL